jgi:hypothetical protein
MPTPQKFDLIRLCNLDVFQISILRRPSQYEAYGDNLLCAVCEGYRQLHAPPALEIDLVLAQSHR